MTDILNDAKREKFLIGEEHERLVNIIKEHNLKEEFKSYFATNYPGEEYTESTSLNQADKEWVMDQIR